MSSTFQALQLHKALKSINHISMQLQRSWINHLTINTFLTSLYCADLPVKKTQCASERHSCKYTHRHKHNSHTHAIIVCLNLWKCLLKRECFELGFEVGQGGEIPRAGRQQIPHSWGNKTERTVTNRFEIAFRDFQVSCSMIRGFVKSNMCREKLKGKREVYHRSDGRQELWSCICSGISQAANGDHSAVALYGLAMSRAALFWTLCNWPICSAGKPAKTELQQ